MNIDKIMLNSPLAEQIYNEHLKDLPIVDYHNHLSVLDIKNDQRFLNIYDLWIKVDPYKHRAMRMMGIEEKYITGEEDRFIKFKKWCACVPFLIGNPLQVWSYMELQTIFDIDVEIKEENAELIYNKCNNFLENNSVTPSYIFKKMNVIKTCPCFSLIDDISFIKPHGQVVPSIRLDDVMALSDPIIKEFKPTSLKDYLNKVEQRLLQFRNIGSIYVDHALDNNWKYHKKDGNEEKRFTDFTSGAINKQDKKILENDVLRELLVIYSKLSFVVQLHIGAERFTSTRLRKMVGPAGGFAAIGNSVDIKSLINLLDDVEQQYSLPKIVLFVLNPKDNAIVSTLAGSFSKDNFNGLITQGPAWWWCDHVDEIKSTLDVISSFSLINNFVGMTTDSRSFLSFSRHDYFRRVFASWLAEKINKNEISDITKIPEFCKNIGYFNALNTFKED